MKRWKRGYRKIIALAVTAVLAAGSLGSYMPLSVWAEEAADRNTADADSINRENVESGAENDDTSDDSAGAALPAGNGAAEEDTVLVLDEILELPDSDELLMEYIDQLFYEGSNDGISAYGNVGSGKLTDSSEKKTYNELKSAIEQIAAGSRTSTVVEVSGLAINSSTVGDFASKVIDYLMMDCPYDFYWFDKTAGCRTAYSGASNKINTVTFSFAAAEEYRGNSEYTTDISKTSKAKTAVSNAEKIVTEHASEDDRTKLDSYRQEICDLTSYNNEAASSSGVAYGNPWQLIWVFDADPNTTVVCEGYAKAFQYLCDISDFRDNTVCYTVTGIMSSSNSSGGHMWNVVTLGGNNYLVDVTNCDTGTIGSDGSLFLALPAGGTVDTSYTFSNKYGQSIDYQYDDDLITLLGRRILELPGTNEPEDETQPGIGTTQGNGTGSKPGTGTNTGSGTQPDSTSKPAVQTPKAVTLSLNGQKLKNNTTLKVTFNKKYTLKAVVTDTAGKTISGSSGKVTWSTSDKKIAAVSSGGKVAVKKKSGTVTITAKSANGKTAKVKLKAAKGVVKVTKVKITAASRTMNLRTKKSQTLKAAVTPASAADQKVTWKSSNKKIATVNSKGKVTAKKAGTVTITATAKDGSKKKAAVKINIKKK